MKILFDLGHPAHVHYFKNLIKLLEKNDHQVLIIAREKDVTHSLLKSYKMRLYICFLINNLKNNFVIRTEYDTGVYWNIDMVYCFNCSCFMLFL